MSANHGHAPHILAAKNAVLFGWGVEALTWCGIRADVNLDDLFATKMHMQYYDNPLPPGWKTSEIEAALKTSDVEAPPPARGRTINSMDIF